ncbi:hypothetical protein NEAUS03_0598 [Nematocida ausubeli]|nr:hypothetical protein NEAUS03_0598 [Nematocida ausubeli]
MLGSSNNSLRIILTGIAGIIGIASMTVMGMYLFSSEKDESRYQPQVKRQESSSKGTFDAQKQAKLIELETSDQNSYSLGFNESNYIIGRLNLESKQSLPQGNKKRVIQTSTSDYNVYLDMRDGLYKKRGSVDSKENNNDLDKTEDVSESHQTPLTHTPSHMNYNIDQLLAALRQPHSDTKESSSDTSEEYMTCPTGSTSSDQNESRKLSACDTAIKRTGSNKYLEEAIHEWSRAILLYQNSVSGYSPNVNPVENIKIDNALPYCTKPLSTNDRIQIINRLPNFPVFDQNSSQIGYKILDAIRFLGSNFVERKSTIDFLVKISEKTDFNNLSNEEKKLISNNENKIDMLRELLRNLKVYFPKTYESYKDSEEINTNCSDIDYTLGDALVENIQYSKLDSEMNNDNLFKILKANADNKDSLIAAIMLIFSIPEIRHDLTFVSAFSNVVNKLIFQTINETGVNEKLNEIAKSSCFKVDVVSFWNIFLGLAIIIGAEDSDRCVNPTNFNDILNLIEKTISTKDACLAYEQLLFVMKTVYTVIPHYIFGVKMRGKQIFRLPEYNYCTANIKVEKTNDTQKYELEDFNLYHTSCISSHDSISYIPKKFNPNGFSLELTGDDVSNVFLPYFSVIFVDNREHCRKPLYLPYSEIFYDLEITRKYISKVYNLDIQNIRIFFYSIANKTWSSYEHVYTAHNSTHNGYVPVFYYIEIPNVADLDKCSLLMITKKDEEQTDDSVIALPLFLNHLYQDVLEEVLCELPTFTNAHRVSGKLSFKDIAPCSFKFKPKNSNLDSKKIYKGLSFKINTDVELEIPEAKDLDHAFVYNTAISYVKHTESSIQTLSFYTGIPIRDKYANVYFRFNGDVLNEFSYRNSSVYTPFGYIFYNPNSNICSFLLNRKSENSCLLSSEPTENLTTNDKENTTENKSTLKRSNSLIYADVDDVFYNSFLLSCLLGEFMFLDQ